MPKYAVDFLTEIQEVTSATNLDDCTDNLELSTNCNYFKVTSGQSSEENNVVNALMGNAECCFQRYPRYQAHRHVVVSRGVQCSESFIRKDTEINTNIVENNLFNPFATERGDSAIDSGDHKMNFSESTSILQQKVNLNSAIHTKPKVLSQVTEEPPELRESSRFFKKPYQFDLKKPRKYVDDDIDSLSATISNYSLHERLMKCDPLRLSTDKMYEQVDENNCQFNNIICRTPTPRQRQLSFKGSTDAIRGSTTKTLTCQSNESKILNKNENLENRSIDTSTSFGLCKDHNEGVILNNTDLTETTPVQNKQIKNTMQRNLNNENNVLLKFPKEESFQIFSTHCIQPTERKTRNVTADKVDVFENSNEEKPCKSNSDSKCSSTVTFMKGSEEVYHNEKSKSMEFSTINALRRKQKFLMRHTRNSSKLPATTSLDYPPIIVSPDFPSHFSATKVESTPISIKPQTVLDFPENVPEPSPYKPFLRSTHFGHFNNEPSRNNCASRNSNHSEHISQIQNTNVVKFKRTVSFDRNKSNANHKNSIVNQENSKVENANLTCSRNRVRAKYCSNKIIKQKFYIPESANIENILRDPSDRRIKAICDRHNCDIEIYSKVPKSGFLKNIIVLAAPNSDNLRKCVRSLDYSMCWCLTAQLP